MAHYIKEQYQKRIKPFIPVAVFRWKDVVVRLVRKVSFMMGFIVGRVRDQHKKQNVTGSVCCYDDAMVSIVVLSFGRGKRTRKTVQAIVKYGKSIRKEIIVWDNASKDVTTIKALEELDTLDGVRVIFNKRNLRCGGSRREVVKLVNGEFVLFLDNDIEIGQGTIEALLARLSESPDYMGACCRVIFPDHSVQLNGGSMDRDGRFVAFGLIDTGKMENDASTMIARECDWIPGGATMFRREVFDHIQHDPGFPNAYEDNDFSLMVTQKLGKKVVNCPQAKVIHHHIDYELLKDKGTKKYQVTRYNKEMFIRSWLHFYEKWGLIIRDDFIFSLIGLRGKSDDDIIDYIKQELK